MNLPAPADPTPSSRAFASDNYAGIHPEVLAAISDANTGHARAYGADLWTERFDVLCSEIFGLGAQGFPVFNGTGANVTALMDTVPHWGAVICARSAHIFSDEGGAPEKVGSLKLLPVDAPDGKLTPELAAKEAWGFGDEHRAQPSAISISQTTELGTCYTPEEIAALADFAHERGMALHMDGARISNAAAYLGLPLSAITSDVGVDILSLGGTKNGAMGAEAVVVLNPKYSAALKYLRKANMQLGSKLRFISVQLLALYEGDLWLRNAAHANSMAQLLHEGLDGHVDIPYPTQSNVVFARLTEEQKRRARRQFLFYDWPGEPSLARLMCSFDTTDEDVAALVAALLG